MYGTKFKYKTPEYKASIILLDEISIIQQMLQTLPFYEIAMDATKLVALIENS